MVNNNTSIIQIPKSLDKNELPAEIKVGQSFKVKGNVYVLVKAENNQNHKITNEEEENREDDLVVDNCCPVVDSKKDYYIIKQIPSSITSTEY